MILIGVQSIFIINPAGASRPSTITNNMSKELAQLIEIAFDVKCYLQVGSYVLHHYEDGSYVDIKTSVIKDPRRLMQITIPLEVKLLSDNDQIIIRIYENYHED